MSDQEEEAGEALKNKKELIIVGTGCFGIQNWSAIWRSTQWGKSSPTNFCGASRTFFFDPDAGFVTQKQRRKVEKIGNVQVKGSLGISVSRTLELRPQEKQGRQIVE